MKHIYKLCPHCNHRMKIADYAWHDIDYFTCMHCGQRLIKKRQKWGGIVGYKLECV